MKNIYFLVLLSTLTACASTHKKAPTPDTTAIANPILIENADLKPIYEKRIDAIMAPLLKPTDATKAYKSIAFMNISRSVDTTEHFGAEEFLQKKYFELGNLGGVFLGIITADLVVKKQLSLEEPLRKYFPNIPKNTQCKEDLKIKHLVTQTAGMEIQWGNLKKKSGIDPFQTVSRDDVLKLLASAKFKYCPGDTAGGTNPIEGALLIDIIETKTKAKYQDLVQKTILTPLKMQDTKWEYSPADLGNIVPGYVTDIKGPISPKQYGYMQSYFGMKTSLDDMYKLLVALLHPPKFLKKAITESHRVLIDGKDVSLNYYFIQSRSKKKNAEDLHMSLPGNAYGYTSFIGFSSKLDKAYFLVLNGAYKDENSWDEKLIQTNNILFISFLLNQL